MLKKAKLIFVTKAPSLLISVGMLSMSALLSAGTVGYQVDTQIEIGQRISSISNGLLTLGKTDTSAYLVSGQYQANGIGKDTSWIASIGTGYRHLITSNMMLGGYLFTDMLSDHNGEHYYMLSPGLEFKTHHWSWVSNVYIPLGKGHYKNVASAEDLGYAGNFVGSDNTATRDHIEYYDHAMIGIDTMIGYESSWVSGLNMAIGGYHYRAKASDVGEDVSYTGIKTQVGYDIGKYANVQAGYRYDKENKSRYMLTLGINFNSDAKDNVLAQKTLTAPMSRHQNINTTKAGVAVDEHRQVIRKTTTGVYYVSSSAQANSTADASHERMNGIADESKCTYENPCNSITVAITTASQAQGNKNIWIEGGHRYDLNSKFTLEENIHLVGRSADYTNPINGQTVGAPRIRITSLSDVAGIKMEDGSHLEGIWLDTVGGKISEGDHPSTHNYAILFTTAGSISLKNMKITSGLSATGTGPVTAGVMNTGGTIMFTGSNEIAATSGSGQQAFGVCNYTKGSTTTFSGSGDQTITATSGNTWAIGVWNFAEGTTTTFSGVGDLTITAKAEGNGHAIGVYNYTLAKATFSKSGDQTITATSGDGHAFGVWNNDAGSTTTFSGAGKTQISAKVADAAGTSEVYGINNIESVNFNQSNTTISVESLGVYQNQSNIKPYKKMGAGGTVSGEDNVACFQNSNTVPCNFE